MNRAIRIMTFAPSSGKVNMKGLYHQLQILDSQQIFSFEVAKFMFKKKRSLLPAVIANHFEYESPNPFRRREDSSLSKIISKTAYGSKSIQSAGEKLWRETPPYLKDLDSFSTFKRYYKSYLLID